MGTDGRVPGQQHKDAETQKKLFESLLCAYTSTFYMKLL
jgi:hypothetical protein